MRRTRCAIGPAKFQPGTRVTYDFGKVTGIPRAKSRVQGVITKCYGRFLATPELGEWMYVVFLDEMFCSEREWSLQEKGLKAEKT